MKELYTHIAFHTRDDIISRPTESPLAVLSISGPRYVTTLAEEGCKSLYEAKADEKQRAEGRESWRSAFII